MNNAELTTFIILLSAALVLSMVYWFLKSDRGGIGPIKKRFVRSEKEYVEDSLKYIFDCEYKGNTCSIKSLAGHLQVPEKRAIIILSKLQDEKLVEPATDSINLTESGRAYALKIIRKHRVIERYLADETSFTAKEWHDKACKDEHLLSEEETEKLASQLGNPIVDPHGDPIPSREGYIPSSTGFTLDKVQPGDKVVVSHIEDEPKYLYKQLLAMQLYPGDILEIEEKDPDTIVYVSKDNSYEISPITASQVTVEVYDEDSLHQNYKNLASLPIGGSARIAGISSQCRGLQRRRLMDMGVVPNARIKSLYKSASGDPCAYEIMNTTLGIRKETSEQIFIKEIDE